MRRKFAWILGCVLFLGQVGLATAGVSSEGIGQWIQEVGVFSGYTRGDLKYQEDLEVLPLGVRVGFDLKPFTRKFGFDPKGLLELIFEPFLGGILQPKQNLEMGLPVFLRYAYPLTKKIYPFVEVGAGPYYMTLGTYEQGSQFNYIDMGGGGVMFFLREDMALSAGYRFRHVSNYSIEEPNAGMNADSYQAGISWFF